MGTQISSDIWMKGSLVVIGAAVILILLKLKKARITPVGYSLIGGIVTFLVSLGGNVLKQPYEEAILFSLWEGTLVFTGIVAIFIAKQIILWRPQRKEERDDEAVEKMVKQRLGEFSDSFQKLSKTFTDLSETKISPGKEDVEGIFQDLSQGICKDCTNCSYCWHKNYYGTYQAAFMMLDTAWQKGVADTGDVPAAFYSQCIRVEDFLKETNYSLSKAKMNLRWHNKLAESREAVATQLGQVAEIMDQFSQNMFRIEKLSKSEEQRIRRYLKKNHVDLKKITICTRPDGKKEVDLMIRSYGRRCTLSKEVAGYYGDLFGKRYRLAEGTKNVIGKEYDTVSLVEDVNFKVLTGVARKTKSHEEISGDNYSVIHLDSGEVVMSLCDGMGAGVKANRESKSAIELLEQFMEAGFSEETALKLINSMLVLKGEDQTCSTMDMGVVNLYSGMCEFVKIGAAPSFIKRSKKVDIIENASLPMGILNEVDYQSSSIKLYEGDFLIMMTDGVLDAIDGEDKEVRMAELLENIPSANPSEIAGLVLDYIAEVNEGEIRDDMTILAAGLWKR
ncbi:SpoIIE family protein phosphatase [Anaerolentibacter hominis]|uniref:SpoIIE family protein phosphatase n=1 Tax=Anaerolentibacter hominis TaxID=3079009 RepID=UPI0031B80575